MNAPQAFLLQVSKMLDEAGVKYMITGSIASTFYGEPRATRDIDLVIACNSSALERLLKLCDQEDWYVSHEAAHAALASRSMFNIIDSNSGLKADLIVRKDREFSVNEFERRIPQQIAGPAEAAVPLASPEDVILSKLEWTNRSESSQQERDAWRVALALNAHLDWDYLDRWASILKISKRLEKLKRDLDQIR